jgi:hypothetical protein
MGQWNVSEQHPSGFRSEMKLNLSADGTMTYTLVTRRPNGTVRSQGNGSGTWNLNGNGNAFQMKFDQGAFYEGTVQGDSNAFTIIWEEGKWTLNFTRR